MRLALVSPSLSISFSATTPSAPSISSLATTISSKRQKMSESPPAGPVAPPTADAVMAAGESGGATGGSAAGGSRRAGYPHTIPTNPGLGTVSIRTIRTCCTYRYRLTNGQDTITIGTTSNGFPGQASSNNTIMTYNSWFVLPFNDTRFYMLPTDNYRLWNHSSVGVRPRHLKVTLHHPNIQQAQKLVAGESVSSVDKVTWLSHVDRKGILWRDASAANAGTYFYTPNVNSTVPDPGYSAFNTPRNMEAYQHWLPGVDFDPNGTGTWLSYSERQTVPFECMEGTQWHDTDSCLSWDHSLSKAIKFQTYDSVQNNSQVWAANLYPTVRPGSAGKFHGYRQTGVGAGSHPLDRDVSNDSVPPVILLKIPTIAAPNDPTFQITTTMNFYVTYECIWETMDRTQAYCASHETGFVPGNNGIKREAQERFSDTSVNRHVGTCCSFPSARNYILDNLVGDNPLLPDEAKG